MSAPTTHDRADVVIVGSGPGGVIPARVLAQKGIGVVCLEQGPWFPPAGRPHHGRDWEWRRATDWSIAVNVRAHAHDYPVDTADETTLMWNGVGGSTGIYTATWPRYRPSDFRKGTEHGLAPDWPISYEDLAPYFEMADEACGVSGWPGDPAMPPRGPFQTRPGPRGAMGGVVARGFDALGWHWWPMPCAILAEGYDGRLACNNCGACQNGCPRGSLNDMAVTHWPKALAAGVELRTDSRVERIETDASGRATGVVYIERNTGVRHFQPADVVILAANGVGTPRLLLLSESAAHPRRTGQPLRPGRPQPDAPHALDRGVLGRRGDRGAQGPDLRHRDLRGVRGERHLAGFRQRLHAPHRAAERRRLSGAGLPFRQRRALGGRAPRMVHPALRARHRHPGGGRRPAAARQPRHPLRHHGRFVGAAGAPHRLRHVPQRFAPRTLRHRPRRRAGRRDGRLGHQGQSLPRRERRLRTARVASPRHRAHGRRPRRPPSSPNGTRPGTAPTSTSPTGA